VRGQEFTKNNYVGAMGAAGEHHDWLMPANGNYLVRINTGPRIIVACIANNSSLIPGLSAALTS